MGYGCCLLICRTVLASKRYYTEPCAATLAVTYSSGSGGERMITTTDLHAGCT